MTATTTDADRPDAASLQDHLRQCVVARSRLHRLLCAAEALDAFLAPRFVTTLIVMAPILLASAQWRP